MIAHPYIKYAAALVLLDNGLERIEDIDSSHLSKAIKGALCQFRLKPSSSAERKETVSFIYTDEDGSAKDSIYLSPHIITTDMQAAKMKKAAVKYVEDCKKEEFLCGRDKVGLSEVPLAGEFCTFSKTIGRGAPKVTNLERGLGIISSITPYKPTISVVTKEGGKIVYNNTCLIPDLDLDDMKDFIVIFNRLLVQSTQNLFQGTVKREETQKGIIYKPQRPNIMRGNFPGAPRSAALGAVALLAAIGELAHEAEYSNKVEKVLEALKSKPIYIICYGDAKVFSFNHHIVDLSKEGNLRQIVDSLYYAHLYNQNRRTWDNTEYQKFDLFASRFLQFFNKPSFQDFLAFRAEYPHQIEILITTYFNKMENISNETIQSAKSLGSWLNNVAYRAASSDPDANTPDRVRDRKSKALVEFESTVFAAKSATALACQILTRAARLSSNDAPAAASLFIEKLMAGEVELETAKNMLVAFSRIGPDFTAMHYQSNEPETNEPQEENGEQADFSGI